MSLPSLPDKDNIPSRDEVVNMILASIAMEELGLSHIINAEGEKLQYALGTIEGATGPAVPATIDDLLELNNSIHQTLNGTMMNQFFLKEKLRNALSASIMQGPTGPQGPARIDVDTTVDRLDPDQSPTVENVGPSDQDVILKFGIPRGATGAAGADGESAYQIAVNNGFTGTEAKWLDSLNGETGPTGPAGSGILPGDDLFNILGQTGKEIITADCDLTFESDTLDIKVSPGPVIKIENPHGAATIIPFSSGSGAVFQTTFFGQRDRTVIVGNGAHSTLLLNSDPINLPTDTSSQQLTFSMPSNGLITAISAFASVAVAAPIAETILTIQIYSSEVPDNKLEPIPKTQIELRIPGGIAPGYMRFDNLENLSIPVSTNTRLAVGCYAETPYLQSTPSIHLTGSIKIDLLPPDQP